MSKNKYYAVRCADGGRQIYEDWPTCKEKIHGRKGVRYKGFPDLEGAMRFLEEGGEEGDAGKGVQPSGTCRGIAIYVDGSYRDSVYSYGFVVVDRETDEAVHRQKGRGVDPEAAKLRNVSGEMKGAMEAVSYCLQQGYKEVSICYDYSGIEMWALGTWKRNNVYTRKYHEFMQGKMAQLKIDFCKVKGHSGDRWNEEADLLAKQGLEA